METLFDPSNRQAILDRLSRLEAGSPRQWGKMNAGQMLSHCATALEVAAGESLRKQALIGKLLSPFIRSGVLGEKPFSRNSPTDPTFVVKDERDFLAEKQRLEAILERFCQRGPSGAANQIHSFFGKLSGEEWGRLMHKHLDHHLRQFGL